MKKHYKVKQDNDGFYQILGPHNFKYCVSSWNVTLSPILNRLTQYEEYCLYLRECIRWENNHPKSFLEFIGDRNENSPH